MDCVSIFSLENWSVGNNDIRFVTIICECAVVEYYNSECKLTCTNCAADINDILKLCSLLRRHLPDK